jgi:hypothetical protein
MEIGEPKRVREVEPLAVPVPEVVPELEPAPIEIPEPAEVPA